MAKFTHLHVHSHYSLLDGLSKIDGLVGRVKELGMDAVALTDHGVLYGMVEFYKKARKAGIKPILGVETYVAPKDRFSKEPGEKYYHLVLLAKNTQGWKNLIKLVTAAHLEGFYYKPRVDKDLLRERHEGLIAASACLGGEIDQALLADKFDEAVKIAREYEEIFGKGNYYLEIQKHPHIPEAEKVWPLKIKLSKETGIPLLATQDSHYVRPEDNEYHDVLLAVQTGNKLSDDDRLTLKEDDFSIAGSDIMAERFAEVPEAISNTQVVADMCNVELELGKIHFPRFPRTDGQTGMEYLRKLISERISRRFSPENQTPAVKNQLAHELEIIEKIGFADFFLIAQDLVNWAKTHGIAVGPGRGSAAGSIVSYILGITDINPLQYDLLFERFLNPERVEMPDFDIDFTDTRRDEVLAYARQKYGEDRVAQIITFGTMAARAAVRDAGRAMGMTYGFCDQVAKLIPSGPGVKLGDALENVTELKEFYENNTDAKKLLDTAKHLEGVVRHASVHACGTVISSEPLTEYVPLQLAPQDKNNIIIQFDMRSVEDLGLLKIDLLGLKNLTIIEDTVRLIKDLHGTDLDISQLPLDDKKTYELLQSGDTVGVFQFESSGMRRYMKDIAPTNLEDLTALVALFRPGPMELIPSFIKRKFGQEKITYIHPKLEPILRNTYGIGVYQEQMMRIATDLAGYTLPEAGTLRKAIGKKIKSLLDEQEQKLVQGMIKNGIDQRTARKIWELFPPFARYGFNKSHAVCYALIGYRTAYLKAHYPEEFMASILNAEVNDIERISFLINEARQNKVDILPPDINKSFVNFAPEGEKIRFGLQAIKNVGEAITQAIIEERIRRGPFTSFGEFLTRTQHKDLNKKSLESMIKAGVFDSLGLERNQGIFNSDEIVRFASNFRKSQEQAGSSLFAAHTIPTPTLTLKECPPATSAQKLAWEKELVGFYLSDHPLNNYLDVVKRANARPISEVRQMQDGNEKVIIAGCVSTLKKITTKSGQAMIFATIEDFSPQPIEVVVFNSTLTKTLPVWEVGNVVLVEGHMSSRNDEPKLVCDRAQKINK